MQATIVAEAEVSQMTELSAGVIAVLDPTAMADVLMSATTNFDEFAYDLHAAVTVG